MMRSHLIGQSDSSVKIGILHSLSGTMAISEPSLKDAALMAIAQINEAGGVLGRQIEPIIEDGQSDPLVFAAQARNLIVQDRVAAIFGCWTSATRKAVLPVVEELNTLLWYPCQYEGLECSPNIFYMGSCTNQQIEPAVDWLLENRGKRFYLLGSDYVFPRTANKIVKAQLKLRGGNCIAEDYVSLGEQEFQTIIALIKQAQPDVVFSTLNGDSNLAFYRQYKKAGIRAEDIPIMAASVAEEELRRLGSDVAVGHYAVWSYFQSLSLPSNQSFVNDYKARYGEDKVTSDPIEAAYFQIYLWKQAVEKAQSFDTDLVRQAAYGMSFAAPGGEVSIAANQHAWKHFRIGKILPTGQFQVVYEFPNKVKPQPWLGVENLDSPVKSIVIDLLGEVSQGIQYNCQLEANSRSQETLLADLVANNQQLRQTQHRLLQSQAQYQELQARENLLKRHLTSQIRNSLDSDRVVRIAVQEIGNLLVIDRCQFLWCHQSEELTLFEPTFVACQPELDNNSCQANKIDVVKVLGDEILRSSCLKIDHVEYDEQLEPAIRVTLQTIGLKALLAAPVHTRSGQSGLIICEQFRQARNWSEQEVELLGSVVDQMAIAIDQAKLYEQSQAAAAAAQAKAEQLEQALAELQSTQAQLIQTEKMSTLGHLVAGIAHEMNNPVGCISGNLPHAQTAVNKLLQLMALYQKHYPQTVPEIGDFAEYIEADFLREDLEKIFSSMEAASGRIHHLVMSLRNFSRRGQHKMQGVDLHEGIESTLLILNNRFKPHSSFPGIHIVKSYGDLPPVECYPVEISQVFTNIIGNAIDALEELVVSGQWSQLKQQGADGDGLATNVPTICIYTNKSSDNLVEIKIIDNGPGIKPEIVSQLFEPFFTTKPMGKGTGLGLSISQQIVVEKHGGKLECHSQLGQGTEFVIELPIHQGQSSQDLPVTRVNQTS